MAKLEEYEPIVGKNVINDLQFLSRYLHGKVIQNINSTAVGGGVAEILHRMIPLLLELGVDVRWDFIKGGEEFFGVTKRFHNALQGSKEKVTKEDLDIFIETSKMNIEKTDVFGRAGDIVFIHDPQPIALVEKRHSRPHSKWIWRCHIDISAPNEKVWEFLKGYIVEYDSCVLSAPTFSQNLPIPQFLISPSIDPLSNKNKELPEETIDAVLKKYKIPRDKPIVTQVSRFDYFKDPVGVIEAFLQVKKYRECQLVLVGGEASDDPESTIVLEEVRKKADGNPDIHILAIPSGSDLEINAIQRASAVILQKSLKEGFALTVTEALWKSKPVVASNIGGIRLQIKHKYSGLLCHTVEGAAFAIKQLLNSPDYAKKLGENGKEHIRHNFLLTRHLKDYLLLFLSNYHKEDLVYL